MDVTALLPAATEKFKTVLIFGPPGSGKGTQGKFLCSAGGHYHLSSGDIFRGLSPDSPAGKLQYKYSSRGHLVPDEVTVQIWHHYVMGLIATNRYFPEKQLLFLDGIPRTVAQTQMLLPYLDVQAVILLEAPHKDVLVKRLLRRGRMEKRSDDLDEEVLKTRMEVYERETVKLIAQYPSERIFRFNAEQRPLEVLRDILIPLASFLS